MIYLRKISVEDLEQYRYWKLPRHQYHSLNGPYFEKDSELEIDAQIAALRQQFSDGHKDPLPQRKIISTKAHRMVGEVSWYWKSKETCWLEVGIVIFDEKYWGHGIGYDAMVLWITELFKNMPELVRLGLTTWSGNIGMIKLSEKLGMKKEAQYRKARLVKGAYFDSVSYGVLREEWEAFLKQ